MRINLPCCCLVIGSLIALSSYDRKKMDDATGGFTWISDIPEDCPLEQSETLTGIYFTGLHCNYHCGDTWYPSWAGDGNLYSPWTDGMTDSVECESWGDNPRTGHAVMKGEDPLSLIIKNTSPPKAAGSEPYKTRYPCGSLVYDGIWYYGTYCLGPSAFYQHREMMWNWPNLGPMPGFQISYDLGVTWTPSLHTPENPLFREPDEFLVPVKMGAPHFVDFGKTWNIRPMERSGAGYKSTRGTLRFMPA